MTSRTALITIAHGRHDHWKRQCAAVTRAEDEPDLRVLVAMEDPELAAATRGAETDVLVVDLDADPLGLPLARARNVGAACALARGVDLLVFLDVDCMPGRGLFTAYTEAAALAPGRILCGPVTYLPPAPAAGYDLDGLEMSDNPHPDRPAPAPGEVVLGEQHDLFWSLSFAVSAATWARIGGFHEGYVGYGGEDTDFGRLAAKSGVGLAWVGGARAYHQHHDVETPPVRHVDAILRNGRIFHRRWGRWPMTGWLDAFVDDGVLLRSADGGYEFPG